MPEILETVKEVVSHKLGIDQNTIKSESKFVEDLGADSLDTVELVMALEDKFNVEIADDQAENIKTVKDAVTHIEELLKI
jgi:acyl carrier protein